LTWYRLANNKNNSFNLWDHHFEKINSKIQYLQAQQKQEKSTTNNPDDVKQQLSAAIDSSSAICKDHLVLTLNGWIEAVEETQKGQIQTGTTGCGPMSMTGLQSKDVTMIKPTAANSSAETKKGNNNNTNSLEVTLGNDVSWSLLVFLLVYPFLIFTTLLFFLFLLFQ
jgi:hypothetical protein